MLTAVARRRRLPASARNLSRAIIAETGLDMSRFPTAAHLVSWAGLCPSARQSGPRTRAGKKGQGDTWLRGSLGQATTGAARTATGAARTDVDRKLRNHIRQIQAIGFTVTLTKAG